MTTKYFLFGEQAANILAEGGSLKKAVRAGCDTFKFEVGADPVDLLAAYSGWYDFLEITEEQYNTLNDLIENER
jgi:hypothetical protein